MMTPAEYDAAEQHAMRDLPNRVIEASGAVAFALVGYPTRVSHEQELWRYADVMQEDRLKLTIDQIGGLTEWEFELVKAITKHVVKITTELGHRVVPGAALIRGVVVYRAIKARFPQRCSVFELGAGSGYVGAMLQADGYFYRTSDVCQAFALWQMRLLCPHTVIPWWEWMGGWSGGLFDVFTANHMLNEMHSGALAYAAKQARKMLGPDGVFLVENFGSDVLGRKDDETERVLEKHGVKVTRVTGGLDTPDRTVTWGRMVEWWGGTYGGIPRSADELFMESIA